jgi:hypothetical protein
MTDPAQEPEAVALKPSISIRDRLLAALDSNTIGALAEAFSPRSNLLPVSLSEHIAEILLPSLLSSGLKAESRPVSLDREAVARIIDPEAFEAWDRAEGNWRKDEAKVRCWPAEEKADAILAKIEGRT